MQPIVPRLPLVGERKRTAAVAATAVPFFESAYLDVAPNATVVLGEQKPFLFTTLSASPNVPWRRVGRSCRAGIHRL